MSSQSIAPILIFGYGNPSRGDDALGPMLLEQISIDPKVELLTDFQLQVEHTLDMVGRKLILFVDASVSSPLPFQFQPLTVPAPKTANAYTTHELAPEVLLATYNDVHHQKAPPCFLLSIRGERFELGTPLSASAQTDLQLAVKWVERLLLTPDLQAWNRLSREAAEIAA
ncbi:MAG: hydrogenase maturation protease [Gammaproteobacteria bacterium]|nr:hydrogenase maturation protease [Gammaproteobacteria bacterium]